MYIRLAHEFVEIEFLIGFFSLKTSFLKTFNW